VRLDGHPGSDHGVRVGLEAALRELARLTPDRGPKTALVDRANEVRPWTLR
ncbi:MAG: tetratricopeptide repeat protein, partial [Dermatophilaceae bacterium]